MKFHTTNPATEQKIREYETISKEKALKIVEDMKKDRTWARTDILERQKKLKSLASVIRKNSKEYAGSMTEEMGKPISQSLAEVEKCAWTAEVYSQNSAKWLADETASADGKKHLITFEPLGTVLAIMPWNFPFWQAFRFAIPAMVAGNTSILKHSNVVPQCALAIEGAFVEAGFPEHSFKTVIADHETVSELIRVVDGVSITGSVGAGERVARVCVARSRSSPSRACSPSII